ncbi:hypothetical protein Hanom_Chr14g01328471 [Helianthus anomalus]
MFFLFNFITSIMSHNVHIITTPILENAQSRPILPHGAKRPRVGHYSHPNDYASSMGMSLINKMKHLMIIYIHQTGKHKITFVLHYVHHKL